MTREPLFRQDLRIPCQRIEGQAVLVVPAKSEMHLLDDVGSFLWAELRKPRSAKDLAASVCEEYDVDPERAERDVRAFLDVLAGKGLVIQE
jgi:hypothetical protein